MAEAKSPIEKQIRRDGGVPGARARKEQNREASANPVRVPPVAPVAPEPEVPANVVRGEE